MVVEYIFENFYHLTAGLIYWTKVLEVLDKCLALCATLPDVCRCSFMYRREIYVSQYKSDTTLKSRNEVNSLNYGGNKISFSCACERHLSFATCLMKSKPREIAQTMSAKDDKNCSDQGDATVDILYIKRGNTVIEVDGLGRFVLPPYVPGPCWDSEAPLYQGTAVLPELFSAREIICAVNISRVARSQLASHLSHYEVNNVLFHRTAPASNLTTIWPRSYPSRWISSCVSRHR